MMAKDRDIDARQPGGIGNNEALRNSYLLAINCERYLL
jgi:hypothetical protein